MQITVRLFSSARDVANTDRLDLDLPATSTIADAASALTNRSPALSPLLARCAFAVNREYVRGDHLLSDGDELAILPPVSGG